MVEKILNDTTPYGKIRASHEGSLHSSTLNSVHIWVFFNTESFNERAPHFKQYSFRKWTRQQAQCL